MNSYTKHLWERGK